MRCACHDASALDDEDYAKADELEARRLADASIEAYNCKAASGFSLSSTCTLYHLVAEEETSCCRQHWQLQVQLRLGRARDRYHFFNFRTTSRARIKKLCPVSANCQYAYN